MLHDGIENPKIQLYGTTIGFSGINPNQDGTFACANISAAYTTDLSVSSQPKNLSFQNITTPLEFYIARTDVKKAVFKGNNSEYVNGRLNVDFTTSPFTVSRRSNYPGATNTDPNTIQFTLNPEDGSAYYFNVMPQTFTKGFTISYFGTDDYPIGTTTTSNSVNFTAGKMKCISGVNVKYSIEGIAKWQNWVASVGKDYKFYQQFDIDNNISMDAGTQSDQGYYFISDAGYHTWRLYQARGNQFSISAKNNYKIKSMTFTYTNKNSGTIKLGDTNISTNVPVTIDNLSVVTFSVAQSSGTAGNGSVAITNIKVSYSK